MALFFIFYDIIQGEYRDSFHQGLEGADRSFVLLGEHNCRITGDGNNNFDIFLIDRDGERNDNNIS